MSHPVQSTDPFILLDDRLSPGGRARLYRDPVEILICHDADGVPAAFEALDRAVTHGLHAAGYAAYELGYALEPRLAPFMPTDRTGPLLWFGLFRSVERLDDRGATAFLRERALGGARLSALSPDLDHISYEAALKRIEAYLRAGDVYQVNFTFPLKFRTMGDPVALYALLRARQQVRYGALLRTGEADILSLSPELFFETDGPTIRARPMKGTIGRGTDADEDCARAAALVADPKSRAENLMIVDLLRNDVGRLARIGSMRVPDLFTVETYPTLHTLTSTVEGDLAEAQLPSTLLRALFPCGSVTGAPKIRAMEIIRELEAVPRGVYTGAVGAFDPGGTARFNVAIRTMTIRRDGAGVLGIGGGIVADSVIASEHDECFLKARFLTRETEPFDLIETLVWRRGEGIPLIDRHEARLAASARWFAYPYRKGDLERTLTDPVADVERSDRDALRLRVLLKQDGRLTLAAIPLDADPRGRRHRFVVSPVRIDAADPFYGHKTTRRMLYDREYECHTAGGEADEVLFFNHWGDLAEGSRTTVFLEKDGVLHTPPVASGALPGVMRAEILADPTVPTRETVLTRGDLDTADRIFVCNAVIGLCPATRVGTGL